MAKRKRLSPVAAFTEEAPSAGPSPAPPRRAPIAEVAGDASARAALEEVAGELSAARAEGRLIQEVPLAEIQAYHLLRDRLVAEDAEMAALKASIAARGQQVPLEVADLGEGALPARYGLISGWRRLTALKALFDETGEDRFSRVKIVLRQPEGAAEAYIAMVEENEIRVGLSYYERARVAARAAEAGVFESVPAAIAALFAAGSKAKRSKIASFVRLYEGLDDVLAYPAAIPERLGLKLAQALAAGQGAALRTALTHAAAPDAEAEQAALARALTQAETGDKAAPTPPAAPPEIAPGIRLKTGRGGVTLSGPGVDEGFRAALEAWLKTR